VESKLKLKKLIDVNCASFSDDTLAESELFGYEKGSFTGAGDDNGGLFAEAQDNVLFLDEIHHLSRKVQAKLLTSLQTDKNGCYSYRRFGATENELSKFQLICATNISLDKLREILLPDFFDRISQRVSMIPNLKEVGNLDKEFKIVWEELFFTNNKVIPDNSMKDLVSWINSIELPGNYRTLQEIAISVHDYISNEHEDCFAHKDGLMGYVKEQYGIKMACQKECINLTVPISDAGESLKDYEKACSRKVYNYFLKKNNEDYDKTDAQLGISKATRYRLMK
jgi:transcriptional regulator with PAS, ATPase and Fis domain